MIAENYHQEHDLTARQSPPGKGDAVPSPQLASGAEGLCGI